MDYRRFDHLARPGHYRAFKHRLAGSGNIEKCACIKHNFHRNAPKGFQSKYSCRFDPAHFSFYGVFQPKALHCRHWNLISNRKNVFTEIYTLNSDRAY